MGSPIRHPRIRRAVTEALEPRTLLAFSIFTDINQTTPSSNMSQSPVAMGNVGYFSADDGINGTELWKTDGTAAGTMMVKNIASTSKSSTPRNFTNVGGTLFFAANDGVNGTELWKSDGTAGGTVMVQDVLSGQGLANPTALTDFNGVCIFYSPSRGVYRSDGTDAGTTLIAAVSASNFARLGVHLYFLGNGLGSSAWGLWKTDGVTATLVRQINSLTTNFNSEVYALNGTLYFGATNGTDGNEPWVSDGTAAGTFQLVNADPGSVSSTPMGWAGLGGVTYFTARDTTGGTAPHKLWRTDGTVAGTSVVAVISNTTSVVTVFDGALYFLGREDATGFELWKSDGTPGGTGVFADTLAGPSSGSAQSMTVYNGRLYFRASDGDHGREVWSTDGTVAGTSLLKDINPVGSISDGSNTGSFSIVNGKLMFGARDESHGVELWATHGSEAGTYLVKDINALSNLPSDPREMAQGPGGSWYFVANDGVYGRELWKTDGSAAGTSMVKDIFPGFNSDTFAPATGNPSALTYAGGVLYFIAGLFSDAELWRSDGTEAGTYMVKDIRPGMTGSITAKNMVKVGNRVFFGANDGTTGMELWVSDGSDAGTYLVKDIYSGSISSFTTITGVDYNGTLIFTATDGVNGTEIWTSDGTAAGTVMLKDIVPGAASGALSTTMAVFNNKVYFSAADNVNGTELWESNGTAAGTVLRSDIYAGVSSSGPRGFTVGGNGLVFIADDAADLSEVWRINSSGTLTKLTSQAYGVLDVDVADTGYIYFNTTGYQLMRTSFAAGTTTLVKQFLDNIPTLLGSANNLYFFRASDSTVGNELWITSGTTANTIAVDAVTGNGGGAPTDFANINGTVFVNYNHPTYGKEWWKVDPFAVRNGDGSLTLNGLDSTDTFALDVVASKIGARWLGTTLLFDTVSLSGVVHVNGGAGGDLLNVNNNMYIELVEDLGVTTPGIRVTTQFADITSHSPQHWGDLSLMGVLRLTAGGTNVLVTKSLNLTSSFARLDIADNAIIVDYSGATPLGSWNGSAYTGLIGHVARGFNEGGWNGNGINSSVAAGSGGQTGIAIDASSVALNLAAGETALFEGETVDASAVLIKYTYSGDANLDGVLNGDDYFFIDSHVLQSGSVFGYGVGDFDYDGDIDGDDYFWLDAHILSQGEPL